MSAELQIIKQGPLHDISFTTQKQKYMEYDFTRLEVLHLWTKSSNKHIRQINKTTDVSMKK